MEIGGVAFTLYGGVVVMEGLSPSLLLRYHAILSVWLVKQIHLYFIYRLSFVVYTWYNYDGFENSTRDTHL